MAQDVYVLTSLIQHGKTQEWRPVAVVTGGDVAAEWSAGGIDHDWIPLELDDISLTGVSGATTFKPRPVSPNEQKAIDIAQKMEDTNARLLKIIDELQRQLKIKKEKKTRRAAVESKPPKPAGFAETLKDNREIADYIETYATTDIDSEFVEELFKFQHATLRLIPTAELKEGEREHNVPSPAKERKYQKMGIETMPPLIVEEGEVVDGNHRFRVAKKLGLTHVWCYDVEGDTNANSNA